MDLECVLAAAIGIKHKHRVAVVTLLDQRSSASIAIERPIDLVVAIDNLGEGLTIKQQHAVDARHRGIGKGGAQSKQVTRTTQGDIKTQGFLTQSQTMLQQTRGGWNAIISRLTHEQQHINALRLDAIVLEQSQSGLVTQIAGGNIV